MPANVAITGGEQTVLTASHNHLVPAYLSYAPDTSFATATVTGVSSILPLTEVYTTGESANWTSAREGMTAKITSSDGLTLRGYYRVRRVPITAVLYIDETSDADPGMIAQQSRTVGITAGDLVAILTRYDLWSVKPYVDSTGIIAQDYWVVVGTHNATPEPIVNVTINGDPGDYVCQVAQGATKAITAAASVTKWPTSSGSTLTYLWSYPVGFTGVSGGSTATLTATAPVGAHWVYCAVTDSIGGAFTIARFIRVHDPSDPPLNVIISGNQDARDRTTRKVTLRLINATSSVIPDGALCIIWGVPTWGGSDVSTATKKFVGYRTSKPYTHRPKYHESELTVTGVAGVLDMLQSTAVSFNYTGDMSTWEGLPASLSNYAFAMWWIARWRCKNLLERFNFTPFDTTGEVALRKLISVPQASILGQLQRLADTYEANAGSRSDGEIISQRDPSMLADRSAVPTRITLTNSMYSSIRVTWNDRPEFAFARWEGISSDLTTDAPTGAQAPSEKSFGQGVKSDSKTDKIFDSQSDANGRAGKAFGRANNPFPNIQLELPGNWDIFEPADMQRVVVQVPASRSPTGSAISLTCIPKTVTKQWISGRRAKIQLTLEAETNGLDGVYIDIRPAQTNVFGNYSASPTTRTAQTWGKANTKVPVLNGSGKGVLLATQDGFVVEGGWRNISPTAAQRTALGTGIKLVQDPYSYGRLLFYGSQGLLVTDNKNASTVIWRQVNIASAAGSSSWTQSFDMTISDNGWTVYSTAPNAYDIGSYSAGVGWIQTTGTRGDGSFSRGVDIETALPASAVITSISMVYNLTKGINDSAIDTQFISIVYNSKTYSQVSSGSDQTITGSGSSTLESLRVVLLCDHSDSTSAAFVGACTIKSITLVGTGTNPFTGFSGGTSTGEAFITDMSGTILRRGYFGWLSKKTISATDYVYYNYTTDYFRTIKTTQVAKYQSDIYYSLSINSRTAGVIEVTAGTTADSTAKLYKSTNWGSSFSATATALTTRGGGLSIPYNKNSTTANAGTSPQVGVVKGLAGGNLSFVALDGTTNVIVATADYPTGAYMVHTFTLDGSIIAIALSAGPTYRASDGGVSWTAKTSVGSNVRSLTGSPTNAAFYLAAGSGTLKYSSDSMSTWTSLYASYSAWASGALGASVGTVIISAFADLALLYSKEVSQ